MVATFTTADAIPGSQWPTLIIKEHLLLTSAIVHPNSGSTFATI
jgi:hypothetical protein